MCDTQYVPHNIHMCVHAHIHTRCLAHRNTLAVQHTFGMYIKTHDDDEESHRQWAKRQHSSNICAQLISIYIYICMKTNLFHKNQKPNQNNRDTDLNVNTQL